MKVRIKQIKKLLIDFLRKRKRTVMLAGGGLILAFIIIGFIDKQIGLFKASSLDPVAYWKFDEGYGTAVNDSSGNGMTGTLGTGSSAPTWQAKEYCISEKCLKFDGSEDYVQRADNAALDIESELSISLWIKPTTLNGGTYYTLVYKGNSTNEANYYLQIYGDELNFGNYQAGWKGTATTDANIPTNQWTHVAMTYSDALDDIDFYVNGILKTDNGQDHDMVLSANNQPFYLGSSAAELEFYEGFLDEVRIYSYVRTPDQIKMDFQGGGSHGSSIRIGDADYSFLSQGLITYWKMDEAGVDAEGETLSNSSGTSHNITLYGDNSTGDNGTGMDCTAEGVYGTGCQFDGVDDYVNLNRFNYFDGTSEMTVSVWIKPDFTTTEASNRYIWAVSNFSLMFNTNQDDFTLSMNPTGGSLNLNTSGLTWTQNTWHHIAATYNGSQAIIYWDGVAVATGNASGVLNPSGATEYLGAFNTTSYHWLGAMDEIRTYQRALTAQEIQSLYNWSPGPVGYWKLDEGSGTTVYDSSGNGNNSSAWSGNTKWVQGKYGSATSHDGSGDRITIPSSTTLDYQPKYTWSAWLNPTAGSYEIFDKAADTNNGWKIGSNGNKYALTIYYTGDDLMCTVPAVNMTVGEWQHIAWTWDGTTSCTGVKFYKNGNLISFESTTSPTGTREVDTGKQILIGGNGYTDYPGLIDDFKIYNYVRTQEQILEDMNAGHPTIGTPVGSTVLHLRMDEGYGTIAHDSSPQGNDSTISGSTWTNDGKSGKGMSFNGTSGYVNAGSNESLDDLSTVTVSAWIYPTGYGEGGFGRIVNKSNTSNTNWALTLVNDSSQQSIRFFKERDTASNATQVTAANGSIQLNRWYHVVGVYDESATPRMKLFIDGVEASYAEQIEGTGTPDTDASYSLTVGNRLGGDRTFQGIIDEVKIYPFALTAEQIKMDLQGGKSLVLGAQSTGVGGTSPSNSSDRSYCIPGDTSTCSAPVLELDFEEATGQTAYDTSTNGNNGQLGSASGVDSSDPTWGLGPDHMAGSAVELDGTDDYVRVADSASLDFQNGSISVSMWVYWNGSSNYERILSKANTGSPYHGDFYLQINGAESPQKIIGRFKTGSGTSENPIVETTTDFPTNQWVFVSATFNTNTNTSRLYINGALIDEDTSSTEEIVDNSGFLCVGCNSSFTSSNFNGKIDNVRIYDYARTPAQIAWEYSKGAPIAHYRLDECQGTTANNSAFTPTGTAGNNGTITAGSSGNTSVGTCTSGSGTEMWANGASGQWEASLDFDEVDDRLVIPDMDLGQEFTVSFWFNSVDNTGTGYQYMYSHGTIQTANSLNIYFNEDSNAINTPGTILVSIMDSNDGIPLLSQDVETQIGLSDSTWHHLVVTVTSSGTKAYIDGVQQISYTNGNNGINPSGSIYIGARNDLNVTCFYDGKLDDVRIYNYPLTTTQIKELYKGGAVVFK
ncbi:LamG domain-containing protein [Candidatus Roizmanbacteria bacterium]|nr:MAG: LamG domain-containing protein [Candidatus Roizmanbacteria bacterium]